MLFFDGLDRSVNRIGHRFPDSFVIVAHPPPGHTLSRLYKGRMLHVRVLTKGLEFEGEMYQSLSAVAKAITGSHTNGYLFFRLLAKGDSP